MAEKYTKIGGVGNLEVGFQQGPFVQFFWKFHNIVVKHQELRIGKNESKIKLFSKVKAKTKSISDRNLIWAVNLNLG